MATTVIDILQSMRKYMSRSKQIIYLCNLTMSVQVTRILYEMFSDCYVCVPFTYEHKDQEILKAASTDQMAEHCASLRRKYAESTDSAVRSFIQLPIADMSFHIKYSLDTEYQPASLYARCTIGIPGPLHASHEAARLARSPPT